MAIPGNIVRIWKAGNRENWKAGNITAYSYLDKVDKRVVGYGKFAPVSLLVALGANLSVMYESWNMSEELDLDIVDFVTKVMAPAIALMIISVSCYLMVIPGTRNAKSFSVLGFSQFVHKGHFAALLAAFRCLPVCR